MTVDFNIGWGFTVGVGFGLFVELAAVFAVTFGFGWGVGLTGVGTDVGGAVTTLLFCSGFAGGTSDEIAPDCHICPMFSLFISNSIIFRFGTSGTDGRVMFLPFIVSCTACASDRE